MKFFAAAAFLLVLTLGTAIAVATWRANQVAEKSIREALSKVPGPRFSCRKGTSRRSSRDTVHSIADEPGTKGLLAKVDVDGPEAMAGTIHEWTSTKAVLLNAKAVFLFDRNGALLARSDKGVGEDLGRPFASVKWVADPLQSWSDASATIREGKVLSTVASSPVISATERKTRGTSTVCSRRLSPSTTPAPASSRGSSEDRSGSWRTRHDEGRRLAPRSRRTGGPSGTRLWCAPFSRGTTLDILFVKGQPIGPIDLTVDGDRQAHRGGADQERRGRDAGGVRRLPLTPRETAASRDPQHASAHRRGFASPGDSDQPPDGTADRAPAGAAGGGAVAIRDGQLDVHLPEGGSGRGGSAGPRIQRHGG